MPCKLIVANVVEIASKMLQQLGIIFTFSKMSCCFGSKLRKKPRALPPPPPPVEAELPETRPVEDPKSPPPLPPPVKAETPEIQPAEDPKSPPPSLQRGEVAFNQSSEPPPPQQDPNFSATLFKY